MLRNFLPRAAMAAMAFLALGSCAALSTPQPQTPPQASRPAMPPQATGESTFLPTQARAADQASRCVDAQRLDLLRLLPPPPAAGSAQERAELADMLRIQATRTPAEVELGRKDVATTVFRFADALGNPPEFAPGRLPRTEALFRDVGRNEAAILTRAKDAFARPRPFLADPQLQPTIARPPSFSYPSGHSTWAAATGLVLADMVPERRTQILAREAQYARNRVVDGVHYPSDVAAGQVAGTVLAAMLFDCPAFAAEEAAAKAELRGALGLP
ncbi:MAG TPA: phosphatase PAP2 family protein [Steroidobacteraceae bacterium]|nr:phosphatase PAP2 family protein [Steroidobacteraceae bacterium]